MFYGKNKYKELDSRFHGNDRNNKNIDYYLKYMAAKKDKFYITTPIYYANDKPHIGHAYTMIAADVLARRNRMKGVDVFFLTGTDEHGAKIENAAKKAGKNPQEFVDEVSAQFQLAADCLNISNTGFIRTTDKNHIKAVQEVLEKLNKKGFIYKGEYEGLYCEGCEQFKSDSQLVDGKCPDHQVAPKLLKEESYFFKLSQFQDELVKKIENDEFKISPVERKNEILSFLTHEKLQDVAISRKNVKWGIPLPFDKKYTTYVWVEALFNYATGIGMGSDDEKFAHYWPCDVQLMAKDILRVHATIWPAMLLALGMSLPKHLFIHGFWTREGQKMGKSLGNVVDPIEMSCRYTADAFRYYLMREVVFGNDGDFSESRLAEKYGSDLASGLGNLVNRVLSMTEKYFDSKVPKAKLKDEVIKELADTWKKYDQAIDDIQFAEALKAVWQLIDFSNKYIDEAKPWELVKKDEKKLGEVLYNLIEILQQLGYLLYPFMPDTAEKLGHKIGIHTLSDLSKNGKLIASGSMVEKGNLLFGKLE